MIHVERSCSRIVPLLAMVAIVAMVISLGVQPAEATGANCPLRCKQTSCWNAPFVCDDQNCTSIGCDCGLTFCDGYSSGGGGGPGCTPSYCP